MAVPIGYNVRSIFYRKGTTALTLLAIALTVCVLCIVLALQQGFVGAGKRTGEPRNVICLRDGSTNEGDSSVTLEGARQIAGLPEVAVKDGRPLACPEIYAGVYMPRENGRGGTNVSLRGTGEKDLVLTLRPRVRIVEGAYFRAGERAVVVGKGLVGRIKGCRLGGSVEIQNQHWPVIGILDGGGSSFDSEIWGDGELVRQAFDRLGWNTLLLRVADGVDIGTPTIVTPGEGKTAKEIMATTKVEPATGFLARLASEEFQLKNSNTEADFYVKQSGVMGELMTGLAGLLAVVMGVGAVFGCTNTLLAAVAGRTREVGGLLALGFRPSAVLVGFLLESLLIGLIGGGLGILLALPVHGMATGTFGFTTFAEATFKFEFTPLVFGVALGLAALIGLLGGAIPALRASRLKPVDALRGE
jgi:putative ABC transport system permease protein